MMARFQVDLMSSVYVTVEVDAADVGAAKIAADKALPRYPIIVTPADGAPIDPDTGISVMKDWEITAVRDDKGDEVDE